MGQIGLPCTPPPPGQSETKFFCSLDLPRYQKSMPSKKKLGWTTCFGPFWKWPKTGSPSQLFFDGTFESLRPTCHQIKVGFCLSCFGDTNFVEVHHPNCFLMASTFVIRGGPMNNKNLISDCPGGGGGCTVTLFGPWTICCFNPFTAGLWRHKLPERWINWFLN